MNKSGTKDDVESIPEDGSELELRNYDNRIVISTQVDQEIADAGEDIGEARKEQLRTHIGTNGGRV